MNSAPRSDRRHETLVKDILRSPLSRRGVLKRAALLGLAVPGIGSLLAACGGGGNGAGGGATATAPAGSATASGGVVTATTRSGGAASPTAGGTAASPTTGVGATATIGQAAGGAGKPGGTLLFGLLRDPIAFDPHINYGASSSSLQGNVYSTLIEYDAQGSLVGALAERWEVSSDGLQYVFTLRQGVTFHNGNPFNAADVVANFDRIRNEATGASRRAELSNLGSYEATDDYTVTVSLPAPFVTLLPVLATDELSIADKEWLDSGVDPTKEMNGTGAFILDSFEPEVKYTLVKNPNYWKPGLPYLDSVQQTPIPDDNARMNALRGGDINFVEYVPWQNMSEIGSDSNFTLYKGFDTYNIVRLNPNKPPFDNKLVRQAMNYAIDREAIIAVAFGGEGQAITSGLFPSDSPWYQQELEGYWSFDPAKAQALLAQAGIDPSTVTLNLTSATISVHLDTAQVVAQQLGQLGFTINIIQQDVPTLTERRSTGDYQMMQDGLSLAYPDPDAYSTYFTTGGAAYAKGVNYSNPTLDRLLATGRATTDPQERKRVYLQFEQALLDEAPWIFILFRPQAEASISAIQGYTRIPGIGLDSEGYLENLWINT